MGERRGRDHRFPPCHWLHKLSLSPAHPKAHFSLPVSRYVGLTLLSVTWGLGWCHLSSSHPLHLETLCWWTAMSHHGRGSQHLLLGWFPFQQLLLWLIPAQEQWCWRSRGGMQEKWWRTLKERGAMTCWAAAPILHPATQFPLSSWPFFPTVKTSAPGEATQDLGILSGSISHPSCLLPQWQVTLNLQITFLPACRERENHLQKIVPARWRKGKPSFQSSVKRSLPVGLSKAGPRLAHSLFPVTVAHEACFPVSWKLHIPLSCLQPQHSPLAHCYRRKTRNKVKWFNLLPWGMLWETGEMLSQKELKGQSSDTVNCLLYEETIGPFCSLACVVCFSF